jgi:hypothetical protein
LFIVVIAVVTVIAVVVHTRQLLDSNSDTPPLSPVHISIAALWDVRGSNSNNYNNNNNNNRMLITTAIILITVINNNVVL